MRFISAIIAISILLGCSPKKPDSNKQTLSLQFSSPAQIWEEALPLGNGRIGLMPDGGIRRETVVLNDITLWSGSPQDADNREAYKSVKTIQQLLLADKNDEAEALVNKNFVCVGRGSGFGNGANDPYGCYQLFANLQVDFAFSETDQPKSYKRTLDLTTAVAQTNFILNDETYTRSYFTSFSDDIGVARYETSADTLPTMTISLMRPENAVVEVKDKEIILTGQLPDGKGGKGMSFEGLVRLKIDKGTITSNGQSLLVKNAQKVEVFVGLGTDYRKMAFIEKSFNALEQAEKQTYDTLLERHVSAYQPLFNRVFVALGNETKNDTIDTPIRLENFYNNPTQDPSLAVLYYQFGRYLSISSTRVGLLPPNLQGLWAHQIQTPWNGDYHLNINAQMNHWGVESGNLPELHEPFIEMILEVAEAGKKTAKAYYNAPGWVVYMITNIWGYSSPGEEASWGASTASGWLCNHLWEHYQFTQDTAYLRRIYPILVDAARFYEYTMIEEPVNGWKVTAPSVSPENAFKLPNGKRASVVMGPTIDNQIVRELYQNILASAQILNKQDAILDSLRRTLDVLPPPVVVGPDGRIMEWLKPYEEVEPQHRHVSHLYGLYPAPFISPISTPEWADAARKSLDVRGDEGTGWSKAWKILFWARLHDGNHSLELLRQLLKPVKSTKMEMQKGGGTYPNLFCAHPPFQIDGNFGGAAGISEMLLQSHEGFIHLLPALPETWSEGEVKGLKARGNYTVDFSWKNGKIVDYTISSSRKGTVKVLSNGQLEEKVL